MIARIQKIGAQWSLRRLTLGACAFILLAIAATMQPGAVVQAHHGVHAGEGQDVALLVPRRIRLIIRYHKPREA